MSEWGEHNQIVGASGIAGNDLAGKSPDGEKREPEEGIGWFDGHWLSLGTSNAQSSGGEKPSVDR
jgi:hypothetical protein